MPKERYSDAELQLLAEAAKALEPVMAKCGYRDLLYGKWSLLTEDVKQELAIREKERATMFVSPTVQLLNLSRWNAARGWGFSEDDITLLEREIPPAPPPPEKGRLQLKARVLEIHLPDGPDRTPGARRTFDELWDILVKERGARPCHLFDLSKDARLALAPNHGHHPGLGWRTIDLGYGWPEPDPQCVKMCGISPRKLPAGIERPHAGILAAAAHFPLWLARMDGTHVPYVWLPGYELPGVPHGLGAFGSTRLAHHPRLTRDGGRPFLYYGWDHVPFKDHAAPMYADVPTRPFPAPAEGDGFGG
ncbi:MAG TPA: hypothetical protein VL283_01015 [Candidatus Baltobacteraceae bacterium]|nr:hypothetical protein [Candidatus Baltobacteraceae bacterium]